VHFLRNALDYVSRRVDDDCLQALAGSLSSGRRSRDSGDRRDLPETRHDLAPWLAKWLGKYPKLTGRVERWPA
jgi:transposase-like protein